MEEAAIELNAGNNYKLFISMITSRDFSDIMQPDKDMKTRLRSPAEEEERTRLQQYAT